MCCPVQTGNGQTVGVIEVINKDKGCFTLADMIVVETIQPSLGIAIENAVLYQSLLSQNKTLERTRDALQARMRELDLLYTLEKVIAGHHENNDALSLSSEHCRPNRSANCWRSCSMVKPGRR